MGVHRNPRFPRAEEHRQLELTVQKRSEGPPSPPSQVGPAAPSWLPAPQFCAAVSCGLALIVSTFPSASQAALCCSGCFLAKACTKGAQVSGVPMLLPLLNDTIHTVMKGQESGTLTNSVCTTAFSNCPHSLPQVSYIFAFSFFCASESGLP